MKNFNHRGGEIAMMMDDLPCSAFFLIRTENFHLPFCLALNKTDLMRCGLHLRLT
jgi:hypothetical protein